MNSKRGFALSIVLWIVAALMMGIGFIMSISKDTQYLTRELHNKIESKIEAKSVLEILKFYVPTANYDSTSLLAMSKPPMGFPEKIVVDGRSYRVNNITFWLQDVSSLENIFSPDPAFVASLAVDSNEREQLFTMEDSLYDWMDKDETVRLNGAEEAYYRIKKKVNYKPRNALFLQNIDELRLVRGYAELSDIAWNRLKEEIYQGKGVFLNMALLTPLQLAKRLKIDDLQAKAYVELRKKNMLEYRKVLSKLKNFNDEIMGYSISRNIKIHIDVKTGHAHTIIEALIDFNPSHIRAFTIEHFCSY